MKKFALATAVILMATVSTPVFAQEAYKLTIASVVPTGIMGTIDHNGDPVGNATIILTRVDMDDTTGQLTPNLATMKKFGPCENGNTVNCVMPNGRYRIDNLPAPREGFGLWREIDVRAEAKGFAHFITDPVRVFTDGRLTQAQPVEMYRTGLKTSDAYMWWAGDNVVGVGFWAKQDWEEEVLIDFAFKGSSWTKAEVDYITTSVVDTVKPGWRWMERYFWAPAGTGTAYYGGSFCGTVTVRNPYDAEDVRETLPKACVGLKPAPATPTVGGKG